MAEEDESSKRLVPDFLNMKYEFLFKIIGRKRKFLLEQKCMILVLIMYIPGVITTALAGTWELFVFNWARIVSTVVIGAIVWLLVRFLRRLEEKLQQVTEILSPPMRKDPAQEGYEEWKSWERRIEQYKIWTHSPQRRPHKWYYLQTVGGAFCGFLLGLLTINPEIGWVGNNLPNELYFRIWYIFVGFLVGGCLYFIGSGFWAIRKYCKDVISNEEILPLDPDRTGGLRELGRLSLDLDLIVALPSVAFPLYLLQGSEFPISTSDIGPWILLSILYALLLVFIFFVSISPAHDDMVEAKTKYLLKIHREYRDIHEKLLHKLEPGKLIDPQEYKRLSGIFELYDRVESMAVWPLDFRTTLRFSLTSLLPLISIGITISF
ncbi:hypothetical protein GTO27_04270 [Candidatus Bathyarchaeota archaeon]|nr:hypothetical protein [Candidatus Bathyarchaeota archaeon]